MADYRYGTSDYRRFMEPGEHQTGTTYPSGLTGPEGKRGYLGASSGPRQWQLTPTAAARQSAPAAVNDQALSALQGMHKTTPAVTDAASSSLGMNLPFSPPPVMDAGIETRGRAHRLQNETMQRQANPHADVGRVAPSPGWDGFYQALAERGVTGLGGGRSPANSNQFVGSKPNPGLGQGVGPIAAPPQAPIGAYKTNATAVGALQRIDPLFRGRR